MDQDRRITADDRDYYYTDAISKSACDMIDESVAVDKPFFMHVCYTAPHWPLHARPEDIERYCGTYRKGWDHFRTARHEELKGQGVVDARWEISPRDEESRDYFGDPSARQEWEDLRMAVYAAQVESMDRGIGRILDTLRAAGIEENTLVMFLSDNGGCAEFLREDGDGRHWPSWYRHTAPPGQTCTVGNIEGLGPGPTTTFMSYDLPWANLSNTPFRLYKHWVHEGGIATPLVMQWPHGIRKAGIVDTPGHVIDIMATCLDAAGAEYPRTRNGRDIQPLEGRSMLPSARGESEHGSRPLFWEHEGNRAVRAGEWKLVQRDLRDWELYNMREDRTELSDLAEKEPERVKQMAEMYDEWAARCGVRGWPVRRMD
jgi:arylsulfatase